MVDNLNASRDREVVRQQNRLNRAAPGGFQSVSRGASRFVGNESLLVEGSQKVTGWLIITGTLKGVGTFLWEGALSIVGPLTVTGASIFHNTLRILGLTTLENSLTVKTGGKIVVEGDVPVTLGKTAEGLSGLEWSVGAINSDGTAVSMRSSGGSYVSVRNTTASMVSGINRVEVTSSGTTTAGPIYIENLPAVSGVVSNLYIDPVTLRLKRII